MSEYVIYLHRLPTKQEILAGALNIHLEENTELDSKIHKIHNVKHISDYISFSAGEHTIFIKLRAKEGRLINE